MHHALRDQYKRRAVLAESVLLLASVGFCATTFAGESFYSGLGIDPGRARFWLGVLSVAAFAASVLLLTLNWKGEAARHEDAASRWSKVTALFRQHRREDGTWAAEHEALLHDAYWTAAHNSVNIPDRKFNKLKAQYLMKVAVSKRLEAHPGAPRVLVWLSIRFSGTVGVFHESLDREDQS